ncbi:MAG: sigma-54-dependent Fis family transcriptional regulator [Deltaproteobacteria bacterium]|jgi:two-component system response regulator AtoC|nr:sigma-54-dependent Fis family transcriptional regulator [Deltaproteobacteria bacterium]
MTDEISVLVIDSEPSIAEAWAAGVKKLGFVSCSTASPNVHIDELAASKPDLAVLGPSLDADSCIQWIHKLKIITPFMPILISSSAVPSAEGPGIMPLEGVYHVASHPESSEFGKTVKSALKFRDEYKMRPDYPVLIGYSEVIRGIKQRIQKVASKDITVLITGETGTGKELIARLLHYHSARGQGPLVKITCGALPDELLESEIFGFQKGAFTGAHKNKPGRLELAHNGTLFIDEIGDLSLSLQAKFLQVLEDKAFARLGGIYDKFVDTRVVAATNSDLQNKVRDGLFRKDLFYRLNVIHIQAPPLRARKPDIPILVQYFVDKYCLEHKKEILEIPAKVLKHLQAYQWPGNVRELENAVRRALALRDWGFVFRELSLEALPRGARRASSEDLAEASGWSDEKIARLIKENRFSLKKITKTCVSEAERQAIVDVLAETQWNRKKAAEMLGVSYKTLLGRIDEFRLKP